MQMLLGLMVGNIQRMKVLNTDRKIGGFPRGPAKRDFFVTRESHQLSA